MDSTMFFTPELISLFAGGAAGFIFKYMAQSQADRQAQFDRLLKRIEADDASSDKAANRAPGKAGEWTRRLIIIAILFGVILAPFFLVLLDKTVTVEITTPARDWLFGFFKTGGIKKYYEFSSYLLIPEIRSALLALVGYYFGSASAKRSNM